MRQQTVIDIPVVQNMREPLAGQLDHFIALASGQLDAGEELATLRAPHAVVAQVIDYADRDTMGTSGDEQYDERRNDRQDVAHRPSPVPLEAASAPGELP